MRVARYVRAPEDIFGRLARLLQLCLLRWRPRALSTARPWIRPLGSLQRSYGRLKIGRVKPLAGFGDAAISPPVHGRDRARGFEWIADWMQDHWRVDGGDVASEPCGHEIIAGIDEAFPEMDRFPAALYRGGHFGGGEGAGVFALYANDAPSHSRINTGFRCAR